MFIKEITVKHFRSIEEVTVPLEPVTALVGPNGSGKSNLIHALDFFYSSNYPISEIDFFNRETDMPFSVTVTFADLSNVIRERLSSYIDNGQLSIMKEARWIGSLGQAKYHGSRLQHTAFQDIRKAQGAAEKKNLYNDLVGTGTYSDLTKVTKGGDVEEQLAKWEQANTDKCERQSDDGQFFGFHNVGYGKIDQFSRWLFIRAVQDAVDEAVEGKGNCLKTLIDLVLRPKLDELPELRRLKDDVSAKYRKILDPDNLEELKTLGQGLTVKLQKLAPGTSVLLGWQNLSDVNFPLPSAKTSLGEGEFNIPVDRAGHGTQRAFLIAILQYLADVRISAQEEQIIPHILLGVEEPELYLHPVRARLLNQVLWELSVGDEGRPGIQTIYATHSPFFTDIKHFPSIRRARREPNAQAGKPSITKIEMAGLDEIGVQLAEAHGADASRYTKERLIPRLLSVMTPMVSEGFFSDSVVLVEGEEDRAALLGMAESIGKSFEREGISVIPVCGKTNLDRPYVIFKRLGIMPYVIFDGDNDREDKKKENHPKTNRALLKLLGKQPKDFPETECWNDGACFKTNLQKEIQQQIGQELYNLVLDEVLKEYDLAEYTDGKKNPGVMAEVIKRCTQKGKKPEILMQIVNTIIKNDKKDD